jgi:separase
LRTRLERIFTSAITGADLKKSPKVYLDDTLLRTFATLSSKCKDEEVEDLVYFILDIYQFHGVQVALAELDIDLVCLLMLAVVESADDRSESMSNLL